MEKSHIFRLGYGCMRFPQDYETSKSLVKRAFEAGVNYFDTAYIYQNGKNEQVLGQIVQELGIRDQITIATKLPHLKVKTTRDFDRLFDTQISRLRTDYIDNYLIHMLCDLESLTHLFELGLKDWIAAKKQAGQIVKIGFSFHGTRAEFVKLVDAYPWDFCMIQFNYLDINNQAGLTGLQYAHEKGLPVFIMEPLRGGTLTDKLSPKAKAAFKAVNPARTLADWGLRYVLNYSQVTCVLSGMSDLDQLEQNIQTAAGSAPNSLSAKELNAYDKVRGELLGNIKVPCTGCGYCLNCPVGVDIPTCFSHYNESGAFGRLNAVMKYVMATGMVTAKQPGNASKCIKCGKCEPVCPQQIAIREQLAKTGRALEIFPIRQMCRFVRMFMKM